MAQFSDIKNDEGQNLLVKNLEKSKFINEYSVLARYLNPKKAKEEKSKIHSLIFPLGCNNSQFKAVSTALNNHTKNLLLINMDLVLFARFMKKKKMSKTS